MSALGRRSARWVDNKVRYLGHVISKKGIVVDPAKIKYILEWPTPKDVHDIISFMGLR